MSGVLVTRHRVSVVVRIAVATGLAALGLWPMAPANAAEETAEVGSLAEAWYIKLSLPPLIPGQPDIELPELPDVCTTLPIPCPELPELPIPQLPLPLPIDLPTEFPDDLAELIYPAGTLHVEMTAGRATARAYIVPDLTLLPDDAKITGGTMVLPLSEEPLAGNRAADTARFGGCLTTTEVTDGAEGRLTTSPKFDCAAAASPAVFDKKKNAFTIDLSPIIEKWQGGAPNYGVALVPTTIDTAEEAAADPEGAAATWHVAINGSDVAEGDEAYTSLTYDVAPEAPETEAPETEAPQDNGGGALPPTNGGGIVTPDPPVAPEPAPAVEPEPVPQASPLAPAPYSLLNSPWYTYRGVVFLPLAFLVALSLTGRSLTRPLQAVARRRA